MAYVLNTPEDVAAMLAKIGVSSIDELFSTIPSELRLGRPLAIPPALSEMELSALVAQTAARNQAAGDGVCFLGGGSYDHFIPAVVNAVASRSEFYTAYTPYQAEASQGSLQAFFEYQTLICELTGMDVANASLYEGGSSVAEAVIMALNIARPQGCDSRCRERASGISASPLNLHGQSECSGRDSANTARLPRPG